MTGNKTMTNLITSIADWLTSSHAVEMPGWLWILLLPISAILLIGLGYLLFWLVFLRTFRLW